MTGPFGYEVAWDEWAQTDAAAWESVVGDGLDARPRPRLMDVQEFREAGYLQEANRRFFHPLGLALEVFHDDDGSVWRLSGVWDCRDDPVGIVFAPGALDPTLAERVDAEMDAKLDARISLLGGLIQPLPAGGRDG